jgi:hypothetical protein
MGNILYPRAYIGNLIGRIFFMDTGMNGTTRRVCTRCHPYLYISHFSLLGFYFKALSFQFLHFKSRGSEGEEK